jgi:hypothetical protein
MGATIHQSSAPPVLSSKCFPPKSPHPLTYNSHVSRPPTFSPPGSLYADRPSMQPRPHFTHPLYLHIFPPVPLPGRTLLPFPTSTAPPVPAYLWRASFLPLALQVWVIRWRCYLIDFLFRHYVFSITTYNIFACVSSCIKQSISVVSSYRFGVKSAC